MSVTGERLNKCAGIAHTISVRIYDIIREVGHGELTADNALHKLIEDVKNARDLGDDLLEMSKEVPWDDRQMNKKG